MTGGLDFNRITIVGLGLIGGSVARGLTRSGFTGECVGVVADAADVDHARRLSIVDRIEIGAAQAAAGADLVVVAVPLGAVGDVFEAVAGVVDDDCVITDVGSAKAGVMASARERLGNAYPRFVPGHPIAGAEQNGPGAGYDSLFDERRVVLTPDTETDATAIQRVTRLWEALGAHVDHLDATTHDRLLAATSHLPHALAFTLVDTLASGEDADAVFNFAGSGFADFTRIAASDPVVWRDIFAANRDAVITALDEYAAHLAETRRAIANDDEAAVFDRIANAQRNRERLSASLARA